MTSCSCHDILVTLLKLTTYKGYAYMKHSSTV